MAVRRRALEPDTIIETRSFGEILVVSDAAFMETAMMFAQLQLIAGGVVTQIVERHPTDLPQEMVTTRAIFEWKDRTDAKPAPESRTGVARGQQASTAYDPTPEELEEHLAAPERDDGGLSAAAAEWEDGEPDGLDPDSLAEEDMDAIPAEQR